MFFKYIKNLNGRLFQKKKKGFSFLEVMISIFIFILMMTTISMAFANLFNNYKKAKVIQRNLEDAQFAMNSMAKALRVSSVIIPSSSGTVSSMKFFNYSDSSCASYRFQDNSLQVASDVYSGTDSTLEAKKTWCEDEADLSDYSNLTSSFINGIIFDVVPSSQGTASTPSVMGKVTILMEVCASSGCPESQDKVRIQTSVSLRDYSTIGL